MRRLIYVSRLTAPAAAALPSTMEDILVVSNLRNWNLGVTGLLWCDGLHFAQVLEGADESVEAVFSSIRSDPRHGALKLRFWEETPERRFGRWSMCGMTLSDVDEAVFGAADEPDLYAAPADQVLAVLAAIFDRYGDLLEQQHRRIIRAALPDHFRGPRPL